MLQLTNWSDIMILIYPHLSATNIHLQILYETIFSIPVPYKVSLKYSNIMFFKFMTLVTI